MLSRAALLPFWLFGIVASHNPGGAAKPVDEPQLRLDPANVNKGSTSTGQNGTVAPGQIPSRTDGANFINFCSGKTLTNGQQNKAGSCNGIVMGDIPAHANMVSAIILHPAPGQDLPAERDFDIRIQVANLAPAQFTNPQNTYFSSPQALSEHGYVKGHVHVTIQDLGDSLTPSKPLDASKFIMFKGVNDIGDGKGGLSAAVKGGLKKGYYRVCTMTAAANHQPVVMPVAQRGSQDDCTKFTVGLKSVRRWSGRK